MASRKPRAKGKDLLLRDLPIHLHKRFKEYCNRRGLSMRARIEQLMRVDIEKRKVQEIDDLLREHNQEALQSCNIRKS